MAHAIVQNSQRANQPQIASMSSQYHNLAICDLVRYLFYCFIVHSQSLLGLNLSHQGSAYSSPSKIAMFDGLAILLWFLPSGIVDIVIVC
jgi:hypothetical protein